jgi:hypothetical protein
MKILLTFDVEVWCNSWSTLDADFPAAFERYVYGRSARGDFALPKTLEILGRHALKGVFFVEPLFASRFGVEHLATIVELVRSAGQEIQLHLHPEWVDEARTPLLPDVRGKRQHLFSYTRDEQQALIAQGLRMLAAAGVSKVNAFRAGSFACNADTFAAVRANGLPFDSSLNTTSPLSASDLDEGSRRNEPHRIDGVDVYPMSVFRDGFGRMRHAQLGACSYAELRDAIVDAERKGWSEFVILSHNFELLRQNGVQPDPVVVGRFEHLARFLADHRDRYPTVGFHDLRAGVSAVPAALEAPQAGPLPTARRYCEQLARRVAR